MRTSSVAEGRLRELRARIKQPLAQSLQMDDKMMIDLIQKFELHSLDFNEIKVCFREQFKEMIGALGNFFIGERLFSVCFQLSINMEKKAGEIEFAQLDSGV